MRPVNLIPTTERRGEHAPLRAGVLSYVVVGVLALVLGGVVAVVLTGNKIAESKAQVASLQTRQAAADARASQVAPYVDFAALQDARHSTVVSLAQSRFDWERVLRQLAIVIPSDVWLTSLSGGVGGTSSASGSSSPSGLADSATGPTLTISGCATSQPAVASFLNSLRDIDGVTRVGLQSSVRSAPAGASSGGTGGGGACSGSRPLETFQALATFDAVPAPAASDGSTAAPTAVGAAAPAATTPTTPATTSATPAATTSTTPATTSTTPVAPAPTGASN
jgi:Tfp pilus assembly protein PilN